MLTAGVTTFGIGQNSAKGKRSLRWVQILFSSRRFTSNRKSSNAWRRQQQSIERLAAHIREADIRQVAIAAQGQQRQRRALCPISAGGIQPSAGLC